MKSDGATPLRVVGTQQSWALWNQQQLGEYEPRTVPEGEREAYAAGTSLREFYDHCIAERWEPIGCGDRSRATLSKERQALNRWERYTRDPAWVGLWPGPSLKFIQDIGSRWFDDLWNRMQEELAPATVQATRSHLNVIIRHAWKVKAISHPPLQNRRPVETTTTEIFTPRDVSRILRGLVPFPPLRVAFWLALHAGPRPVDLFSLRWEDVIEDALGRKLIVFRARKTAKLHGVPISAETWSRLDALERTSAYIFPGLSSPESRDPERSYHARTRNGILKAVLDALGIAAAKPWQMARATCNERFESHRAGVGEFILGHACEGVNARNYRNPTEAVHEAVATLPRYEEIGGQQEFAW